MKINLSVRGAKLDAAQYVRVNLCFGKPSALFADGTAITPGDNGSLNLYLEEGEFKALQKAGRTIANFGLFNVDLNTAAPLSVKDMLFFVTGMYDGRTDIKAAFNASEDDVKQAQLLSEFITEIRDLANSQARISTPLHLIEDLSALCQKACSIAGRGQIKSTVIKRGDAGFEAFTGLNAVGAGSCNAPAMGMIEFLPEGCAADAPLSYALVGKGITFDSGGYDLKPPKFMASMRTDKTGAVSMAGVLALAIVLGLNKHVKCYLPCTENLVSGSSMLPGDIYTYSNGVSVEINNTDAEGRLILADGLLQAKADGAQAIIDAATLTGAAKVAVGRDITAVLTPSNQLPKLLTELFADNEEELWPLPMRPYHKRYLKSSRADMSNAGSGEGTPGASTAAAFLQAFVDQDTPWLHFDLSSAYMAEPSPYYAGGMSTAAGVYSLAQYLLKA